MVLSLVKVCAREVVRDHSTSPCWLSCVPRELYRPLLEAAFRHSRPLAVGELVQRWPEKTLSTGGKRQHDQCPPNRLCVQALLLAVVRGLSDKRCCLQLLDLCGLQCEEGRLEDSMGGWSLTVALCSMVLQARAGPPRGRRREGERERKRSLDVERERQVDGAVKRDRGLGERGLVAEGGEEAGDENAKEERMECLSGGEETRLARERVILVEDEAVKGVRRRMEQQRRMAMSETKCHTSLNAPSEHDGEQASAPLVVRADLFVNARSWERVRGALGTPGPLRLHCRYLRVEELQATSIATLLGLLPGQGLLGLDLRYSSLGVTGLALLLPLLARFPQLQSLRLHYCNLDLQRAQPGQQGALLDMCQGLGKLKSLRKLSLTALRLPGHLRTLLSSIAQPLEVLEMPYLSLTPADLAYLSGSLHASSLQELDLSENRLDEASLPSLRRLLSRAEASLVHLSLCGCGLSDGLLGALLPWLARCGALRSLRLSLNPLSHLGLLELGRVAATIPSLRLLLYPNPLEEYEEGLPPLPSSAQLLDWPLRQEPEAREATLLLLEEALAQRGRPRNLTVTSDLLSYPMDLIMED